MIIYQGIIYKVADITNDSYVCFDFDGSLISIRKEECEYI